MQKRILWKKRLIHFFLLLHLSMAVVRVLFSFLRSLALPGKNRKRGELSVAFRSTQVSEDQSRAA